MKGIKFAYGFIIVLVIVGFASCSFAVLSFFLFVAFLITFTLLFYVNNLLKKLRRQKEIEDYIAAQHTD